MSISCHMEYKTLIEASCTNNILIGENAKKQNKNKTKTKQELAYFGLHECLLNFQRRQDGKNQMYVK